MNEEKHLADDSRSDAGVTELPREEAGIVAMIGEMRSLYASGETDDALRVATLIRSVGFGLGLSPTAILGLAAPPRELLRMPLDPRAGFMLARIDGRSPVRKLVDESGLPPTVAMELLEQLVMVGAAVVASEQETATGALEDAAADDEKTLPGGQA